MQFNWVDLIIIIILIYFVIDSWHTGLYVILSDFLGFLFSLIIALRFYSIFASLLTNIFQISHTLANALGFFITAGISEAILGIFFAYLLRKIPYKFWKKPWSKIAGFFPSLGQALIIISFILTLVMTLPVSPTIKRDVAKSAIGGYLIQKTTAFETRLNEVFGGLAEEALTYITVKPESTESLRITCDPKILTVDAQGESEMFKLVNEVRRKAGVPELKWRIESVPVARVHAKDMCERQYFGHVSPEGRDVGDRLEYSGVVFQIAGENLAFAPTLSTAHTGLMNSEGHKRNILDPEFKRIGIGVMDNGIYGKLFVQVFTD